MKKIILTLACVTTIHPRVKKFTAVNSKISLFQSTSSYSSYPSYTVINSYASLGTTYGLTFINSIVDDTPYYSELINCYGDGSDSTNKASDVTSVVERMRYLI